MKVIKMSVLLIKTMLKSIALFEKPKGQLTEVQNYALTPPPSPPRPPPTAHYKQLWMQGDRAPRGYGWDREEHSRT